ATGTVTSIAVDPDQRVLDLPTSAPVRDNTLALAVRSSSIAPLLTLYPNPCHDQLQLTTLPAGRITAEVLDATGRLVLRQPMQTPQLNTHALAPGLYYLRLLGTGAELLGRGQFVRE